MVNDFICSRLHKLEPLGYHLTNVICHALCVAVYTGFLSSIVPVKRLQALAGCLFALHPVHTEAVAGVVGRADILSALFFLASLWCYVEHGRSAHHRLASNGLLLSCFVTALASCLCKEIGLSVLGVCCAYDVFVVRRTTLRRLVRHPGSYVTRTLTLTVIWAFVMVACRVYMMGSSPLEFSASDNPVSVEDSRLTRCLTLAYLVPFHFWLLLCPAVLSFDWSMDSIPLITSLSDSRNLVTFVFYGCLVLIAYWCFRCLEAESLLTDDRVCSSLANDVSAAKCRPAVKKRKSSSFSIQTSQSQPEVDATGLAIFGIIIMVVSFIPCTNLFFYVGFVAAERVLYIPSLGYCLLLTTGVYKLHTWYDGQFQRRVLKCSVYILLLAFVVRTVTRNTDWWTEERLYTSGIPVNPAKSWGNLGNVLLDRGRTSDAERAYRNALDHRGNMGDTWYNLGCLLQKQGRHNESLSAYIMAIQCRPRMTSAHLNKGMSLYLLGRLEEAAVAYRYAADIDNTGMKDPKSQISSQISALYNLGRLYDEQSRYPEAEVVLREAIGRRPAYYAPHSLYNMLGICLHKLGRFEESELWFKESLLVNPDHVPAYLAYGNMLAKVQRIKEAHQMFRAAIRLNAGNYSTFSHYAIFLTNIGELDKAVEFFERAIYEEGSDDHQTYFNTANAYRLLGDFNNAEKYYRLAVDRSPENPTNFMNLGAILHVNRKYEEAERVYLRALELKPDDATTYENLNKLRNSSKIRSEKKKS